MNRIDISKISIENKNFWNAFFSVSYPNGYDEEQDLSVSDITSEFVDMDWWDDFTGYDEVVFEENDGYLDEPVTIVTNMDSSREITVVFHPGDILYFVNGENVGSTGPHWKLQIFSFDEVEQVLANENGEILFWLLLPLAKIAVNDVEEVVRKLEKMLESLFETAVCKDIARCLVNQLVEA